MTAMADTCTAEENDGVLNTYFTFEIPIALTGHCCDARVPCCSGVWVYAKPYLGLRQVVIIGGQAIQALLAVTTQFLELRFRIAFLYVVRFPCFDESRQRHHGETQASREATSLYSSAVH